MKTVELCGKVALVAVDGSRGVDIRLVELDPYGTKVQGQRLYISLKEWRELNATVEELVREQR